MSMVVSFQEVVLCLTIGRVIPARVSEGRADMY